MNKAYTMSHLVVNDKPQDIPVGYGKIHNIIPGLNPNTIQVVFEHTFTSENPNEELLKEERMFRVVERYTKTAPTGYDFIGHVTMVDGREFNIFGQPKYPTPTKKEPPMITVLREQLMITSAVQCKMVGSSKIVHAAEDRQGLNRIDIWYEQNGDIFASNPARNFVILRTGKPLHGNYEHVKTLRLNNGEFCHIYAESVL